MRTTLPEPWLGLLNIYGTIGTMLGELGVSRRTFYSWVHGDRPPNTAAQRLVGLFLKSHGLSPPDWDEVIRQREKRGPRPKFVPKPKSKPLPQRNAKAEAFDLLEP